MERAPADARAALSAAEPADMDMTVPQLPRRDREPASLIRVSQRATEKDSREHENEKVAHSNISPAWAGTSSSLAHHVTLTGRCFETAGTWPSPSEELRARSTPDKHAERQKMVRRSGQTSTEALSHTTFTNIQSPEFHTQRETIRGPHKRHLYTSSQACNNDGAPPEQEQVKTTKQTTLSTETDT
jgi:hypothetical protein